MIDPKNIAISSYTYELPAERIAVYPLPDRDSSKLLICKNGNISEDIFRNMSARIPQGSLLIFNDSKVVNARLVFKSKLGKIIEIFCLQSAGKSQEEQTAFSKTGSVLWECMIGNLKAWKFTEESLEFRFNVYDLEYKLSAKLIERLEDTFIVSFSWQPGDITFAEVLESAGVVPLPPYIKRDTVKSDRVNYQTVYAHYEGSVAAPTAGLHFTENVLNSLKKRNIDFGFVTLHVGAGTFKPVKSNTISEHSMHAEYFSAGKKVIEIILNALEKKNNIISVGTTSMRTVESLYWYGVQLIQNRAGKEISITQWEPYDFPCEITAANAFKAVLHFLDDMNLDHIYGKTSIIIVPGYEFRVFDGLISNFHQPGSTLLLLVAAFIGNDWKVVYDYALNNGFRFLSYGDSSILFK